MNRFELDADYITCKSGTIVPMNSGFNDGPTIYLDLNGGGLSQQVLDIVTSEANRATGCVNIILRRVSTAYGGVPRLIADRGEIYDALAELLAERNTILLDSQNDLP